MKSRRRSMFDPEARRQTELVLLRREVIADRYWAEQGEWNGAAGRLAESERRLAALEAQCAPSGVRKES